MLPKTYVESMNKHVNDDREISVKESNKITAKLNSHAKSFVKIIGIGKSFGRKDHKRAIANAVVSKDGEVAVMRGSDKDHKPDGIHMRPICNGMVGAKKSLSEMVSELLEAVLELNGEKVCKSTEEMICSMKTINDNSAKILKQI